MFIASQLPKSNSPSPPFLEERAGERRPFARIRFFRGSLNWCSDGGLSFFTLWKWRQCQATQARCARGRGQCQKRLCRTGNVKSVDRNGFAPTELQKWHLEDAHRRPGPPSRGEGFDSVPSALLGCFRRRLRHNLGA
jgi:hypothetical protein